MQELFTHLSSYENDADGIEKLVLKTQVREKLLHSEVNQMIQIIFSYNFSIEGKFMKTSR